MTHSANWRERIIVALDFPGIEETFAFLKKVEGHVRYVKVGMELYYAVGPQIVTSLKEKGFKVFVDLKVHDIPNTAKGAMKSLARLGADLVNVHAAGGRAMMQAAREGLEAGTAPGTQRPLLIGVTMLTSTSREMMNSELLIQGTVEETVLAYARLTKEAGLDGVVSSPWEVPVLKRELGAEFLTVTPGIRPHGAEAGDQTRITTPEEAFRLGSDFIVMGRAITGASDPLAVWEQILAAETNSHI